MLKLNNRQRAELARLVRNHKYEVTDDNRILFNKVKILAQGMYVHDINGRDERMDPNLIVDQGLIYLLGAGLYGVTPITTWYLSLYGANYTPLAGLTAASYPATASEITSNTEGYSDTTRRTWAAAAPASNAITNNASKAAFTIATASSVTIYGAALHSSSVKGGTTGTLLSAVKFASSRTAYNTDVFNLGYTATLVGA